MMKLPKISMIDNIKKAIKRQKQKPTPKKLTPMELANRNKEPYVNIKSMDVNPENISDGSFELEFNDLFVAKLVRAGYSQKAEDTDIEIVDRWFQTVCRNVAQETYEQYQADPDNRTNLGNGYTEVK